MKNIPFSNTKITGGFWKAYQDLIRGVTIQSVYRRYQESGRFDAFSCRKGETETHIYWDSDVAKWMEAAAYLIALEPDPELESIIDHVAADIRANQLPNGYFNSHFITEEPENIFKNRDNHELYCTGHLIEAAIAYADATGKEDFLNCMIRCADYIYEVFYKEKSAGFVTPGHPEIELALLKLFDKTGDDRYRILSEFFIEERGKHEKDYESKEYLPIMTLSHMPLRKMKEASGHSVRACYLYTAMADLAVKNGDEEQYSLCQNLFDDIVKRKLAVTGGTGALIAGEAFDLPYRLPNMTSYNETCASIALTLFAEAMQKGSVSFKYAETIEKVLYNGMLSGLSLSGDAFFYENALEIDLKEYDRSIMGTCGFNMRRLERAKAFTCSCCPPNLCRTIASVARYLYSQEEARIYCHQFMNSETSFEVHGQKAVLVQETDYPVSGRVKFRYEGPDASLYVRIPSFCSEQEKERLVEEAKKAGHPASISGGYMELSLTDGCTITMELPMRVRFVEASPRVRECSGKYAVMRGPVVYCMESVDNGEDLWDLELRTDRPIAEITTPAYPVPDLLFEAYRHPETELLYREDSADRIEASARMIPYFAFANRGITNMQIWTRKASAL